MDHACGTCKYFSAEPPHPVDRRPKKGVCTHPVHRARGAAILIWPRETRCRRGFGDDDWTPPFRTGVALRPETPPNGGHDDIVIDERPSPRRSVRRVSPRFAPIPIYVEREDAVAD